MEAKIYKFILFIIIANVLATIGLQVFWNIKNYRENKTQLIKDVQIAFDNSIDYYYVEDSKNDFLAIYSNDTTISNNEFIDKILLDSIFEKNKIGTKSKSSSRKESKFPKSQSLHDIDKTTVQLESITFTEDADNINPTKGKEVLSILKKLDNAKNSLSIKVLKGKKASDSISKLKDVVNKVIVFAVKDSIDFQKLSKATDKELLRINIDVAYSFQHFKADTIFQQFQKDTLSDLPLTAISGTTYLPSAQKLQISFSDPTLLILKRSFVGIFLSFLLMLSVFSCLMFLLQIINRQKKIDEMKNDLISNITHEFKTPITTISTAIEGIKNFNEINDIEKTNRYLDISRQQLQKLEIMVEKLLETASLNTDQLNLKKEALNIVELIKTNVQKHEMTSEKEIYFTSDSESIICNIDVFHFENAVSNLIDNALKYGGTNVAVHLTQTAKHTEISVEDNGTGIDKTQREKIFEQFYRIPKGNIHDVKGFGIGLFYAKKIIEKHGGSLELIPSSVKTIFKIILSNV